METAMLPLTVETFVLCKLEWKNQFPIVTVCSLNTNIMAGDEDYTFVGEKGFFSPFVAKNFSLINDDVIYSANTVRRRRERRGLR